MEGKTRNLFRPGGLCILLWLAFSLHALALDQSMGPNGCNVEDLHSQDHIGSGVKVGVISAKHARVTHEAFYDKDLSGNPIGNSYVTWYDATDPQNPVYEPHYHDTTMGGIIMSRGGAAWPDHLGAAPGAELYTVKVVSNNSINAAWLEDALEYLANRDVQVIVTGIQLDLTADGSSIFSKMYDYFASTYNILFINPAGNDRSSVTVFGDGFNGVTVGGLITVDPDDYQQVGTASNPGTTVDGRHKPELTAPAQYLWVPTSSSDTAWTLQGTTRGETSWSGPHAAGVGAVLLGHANSSSESDDHRSEVLKAALVNSAFPNLYDENHNPTTGQLWNAYRGYGRIDGVRAFEILSAAKISEGQSTTEAKGWAYEKMEQSYGSDVFQVYGRIDERLVLTVTWDRKITRSSPLNYSRESSPQFDLDLEIRDPGGSLLSIPNTTLDNLEKVDLLLNSEGYYEITILNTTSRTNRYYGLAFELLAPLPGDFNIDYFVDLLDFSELADYWLNPGGGAPCQACDLLDFSEFSGYWGIFDRRYYPLSY